MGAPPRREFGERPPPSNYKPLGNGNSTLMSRFPRRDVARIREYSRKRVSWQHRDGTWNFGNVNVECKPEMWSRLT